MSSHLAELHEFETNFMQSIKWRILRQEAKDREWKWERENAERNHNNAMLVVYLSVLIICGFILYFYLKTLNCKSTARERSHRRSAQAVTYNSGNKFVELLE